MDIRELSRIPAHQWTKEQMEEVAKELTTGLHTINKEQDEFYFRLGAKHALNMISANTPGGLFDKMQELSEAHAVQLLDKKLA
jgi:hypothetical protein